MLAHRVGPSLPGLKVANDFLPTKPCEYSRWFKLQGNEPGSKNLPEEQAAWFTMRETKSSRWES
jgi:hypothetical protein